MLKGKIALSVILLGFFVLGASGWPNLFNKKVYINVTEHPGELCERSCIPNDNRICYFKFEMELYQAMGVACGSCSQGNFKDCENPQCIVGDGTEKGVMSINRQIPGPAIHVCKGDMIIIDAVNKGHGSASAIHWHGLHMRDTPYMDGVPFVTQCPISYGTTFRYWFDASEPGTHFYHSHSGHHKVNGHYGALIVREPVEDIKHNDEYDYDLPEHYILLSDWMHSYGEQLFPGLPSTLLGADSLLINGRGPYIKPKTFEHTKVPVRIFYVEPGKRYRMRVINSISNAFAAQLQIQGHSFKVIASDSFDVQAEDFDTLTSNSGERYDFVLTANHTEGDFWIKAKALGQSNPIEAFALLRYKNHDDDSDVDLVQPPFPNYSHHFPSEKLLNDPSATCEPGTNNRCVTELTALEEDQELLTKEPDQQIFVAFNNMQVPSAEIFKPGSYPHFQNPFSSYVIVGAINNISINFPSSPPLTQSHDIDESSYCDQSNLPAHCNGQLYCTCTHRIKVKLNGIIEIVIVDEAASNGNVHHPFHLHGHKFLVAGLGQHPSGLPMTLVEAKKIEKSGRRLARNSKTNPPFKDTISIPNRGYAILRVRADNPGFWLMHCHYEWHLASGMGVIIQVGETKQMVKAPKDFPKCKNYEPRLKLPNY